MVKTCDHCTVATATTKMHEKNLKDNGPEDFYIYCSAILHKKRLFYQGVQLGYAVKCETVRHDCLVPLVGRL